MAKFGKAFAAMLALAGMGAAPVAIASRDHQVATVTDKATVKRASRIGHSPIHGGIESYVSASHGYDPRLAIRFRSERSDQRKGKRS